MQYSLEFGSMLALIVVVSIFFYVKSVFFAVKSIHMQRKVATEKLLKLGERRVKKQEVISIATLREIREVDSELLQRNSEFFEKRKSHMFNNTII